MHTFPRVVAIVGATMALLAASSARAGVVPLPQFEIIENAGYYTAVNNTSDWEVNSFVISNPLAASGSASTTDPGWVAHTISSFDFSFYCNCNVGNLPAYAYEAGFGSTDILPGQSVSDFYFTGPLASEFILTAIYIPGGLGNGDFEMVSGVTTAVPEPSTWAMMAIGFFGVVALRSRRHGDWLRKQVA